VRNLQSEESHIIIYIHLEYKNYRNIVLPYICMCKLILNLFDHVVLILMSLKRFQTNGFRFGSHCFKFVWTFLALCVCVWVYVYVCVVQVSVVVFIVVVTKVSTPCACWRHVFKS